MSLTTTSAIATRPPASRRRAPLSPEKQNLIGTGLEIVVPLLLLVAWEIGAQIAQNLYFPPPTRILTELWNIWVVEGGFATDVLPSLLRLSVGLLIAIVLGVTFGVILGISERVYCATEPLIEFLRAVPPPALIPFGIVVIGIGDDMKILLIGLVAIWPILLSTQTGIHSVDGVMLETSRSYRMSRGKRLFRVLLPAASPQILAGIQTALAIGIILMVVSEMVAAQNGLGYFIIYSSRTFAITDMWSGIILLGVLGYVLNLIFLLVQRIILGWYFGLKAMDR